MIGEILGNRYEILEQIGEGGMSIVYKALDSKLNRNVAVKVLKKELSDNEDIVDKFKREATAIATLSHSNIVNVLDVGTQDEINYIVMEYVKGKTLKEVIVEFGKLNYETTIRIGTKIAKALECAHKNNIIHRDVKPQNVLVTEEGFIKVTDFGIAKSVSSATLTNTTTIMGSAQYLSPEQARGSIVDVRTDIYSLGIVLYEMVTGKLPFEADSPVTIALKHIQEEVVPPKQLNSRVPDSLNKLILKTMEKDASKRYQTAKELISDLEKIKEDPNAIIDQKVDANDGRTMVMPAVNPELEDLPESKDVDEDEDYYDEDEEYYDEDEEYEDEDHESPKKEKNKKNKKKLIMAIIAVIALLLVVTGAGALMYGNNSAGEKQAEEVKVPNIKGMSLDQAKAELDKVGLTLEEAGTEESTEPENTVLEVSPDVGSSVKKGDKVRVMLSAGVTKIKVPDITEESIDDAKKILEKSKLTNYEVKNQSDDSIPSGNVIKTDPTANSEVAADTKITIYVSTGPSVKYVTVPDVRNKSLDDATQSLSNLGLSVNTVSQTTEDQSKDGKVSSMSPSSGQSVKPGTQVTITYWKYKAPEKKKIDTTKIGLKAGMSMDEAMELVEGAGLKPNAAGGTGTLIDWSKGSYDEGSTITLTFKQNTTTPDPGKTTDPKKPTDPGKNTDPEKQ
ncbi:Stk1 family PASTA domain-containing Ser/Thr kinase [Clostridium sp. SHJSY1]|uniref:Stk1 family PASTA domain-containing Ser/Thr kinase n=1 Tax=Clostridium sp. SHJSY1 TaxID=2942483 RepID=UPI0028760B11|nr:Stk1 family PASTA domain-containing Ser/Thr kinase [Clostridium sp. SHJSY1]MDS0524938.1 Stk1 family PASTA domain-containing Ser/Thr kinase [Clostridium sp. SHJSY1]